MLQLQPVMYKQQYLMFVERCFFECDVFSFCLPVFGKNEFTEYKNKIKPILNTFKSNLIYAEQTKCYLDQKTEHINEVYYYNTLGLSCEPFNQLESIYDWRYPNFPEDICFYKNGECWLQSIAHEHLCFIYDDSKEIKDYIKWLGFQYIKSRTDKPPKLSINVRAATSEENNEIKISP